MSHRYYPSVLCKDTELTFELCAVTVVRKRYMETHIPAIMESKSPWRGFPYRRNPCCKYKREKNPPL